MNVSPASPPLLRREKGVGRRLKVKTPEKFIRGFLASNAEIAA
jgi:hypothetical protein